MIAGAVGLAVVFFTVWTIFPLLYTFVYSFTDWQPLRAVQHFVGLANYEEALFKDPLFWTSVGNTLIFVIGNVIGCGALALLLALMINSVNHFKAFFRAAFFLPTVTGVVAVSLVWSFIYQPRFGILNSVIFSIAGGLHLPPPAEIGWLTRPQSAMVSIIIFGLWNYLGIRLLILLAGLQAIPKPYYEAAEIDGAGMWGKFWYITLPLLRPSIVFVLITSVINSMQAFEPMFVMPAQPGGPLNSTRTVVLHIFDKTFTLYRFGYGAATSFILFAVIMVITVLQFRLLNRRLD
jgi:multiple sugar transport system permease protein